jgi:hypothetical protein
MTGFSTHLEKLSSVFMVAGRSAPRYQALASIHLQSKALQNHVAEYFIIVVQLCHHMLKFTKKSSIGQIASSLGDATFKGFEDRLQLWGNSIKEEVLVLSSRTAEAEAKGNSRFRALANRFSDSLSQQRKAELRRQWLESLSTYDFETAWKQTRKQGNTTLQQHDQSFEEWKSSATPSVLTVAGKLGSGKSVLMANLVDHLHLLDGQYPVIYFFCRADNEESLKAQTIAGSLSRQLLQSHLDGEGLDKMATNPRKHGDIAQLQETLGSMTPRAAKSFCVLDGLDDCPPGQVREVVSFLKFLNTSMNTSICVSARIDAQEFQDRLSPLSINFRLNLPDDNPDIATYVESELEARLESGQLSLGDPALILEIRQALLDKANGMYVSTSPFPPWSHSPNRLQVSVGFLAD